MLRCLRPRSAAAHAHSTQPANHLQRAKVLPTLPLADELEQPPFASQPNLPNAGIERGGEHGSFMSGHEASPSMKGCSLGMNLRCVVPVRHSARDMCST